MPCTGTIKLLDRFSKPGDMVLGHQLGIVVCPESNPGIFSGIMILLRIAYKQGLIGINFIFCQNQAQALATGFGMGYIIGRDDLGKMIKQTDALQKKSGLAATIGHNSRLYF